MSRVDSLYFNIRITIYPKNLFYSLQIVSMENKDYFHPGKMKALQKFLPEENIPRNSDFAELRRIVKHEEFDNDQEVVIYFKVIYLFILTHLIVLLSI